MSPLIKVLRNADWVVVSDVKGGRGLGERGIHMPKFYTLKIMYSSLSIITQ